MSNRDVTIAARVPLALRTDLEAVRVELVRQGRTKVDGDELDLSAVVRIGLGELRDRVLAGRGELLTYSSGETSARLLPLDRMAPAAQVNGPATSKEAARAVFPRRQTQRRRVLELLEAAGNRGHTGDELDDLLGVTYSGRRTLSELKRGGWVEVRRAMLASGKSGPVRRTTRLGNAAEVYVLTPAALVRLGQERRRG